MRPLARSTIQLLPLILGAGEALANHGPGTSGGGSSTASGETLRAGGFELSLRTDATWFESVSRSEAEARAVQSGEFDGLRSSLLETLSLAYGVTDDLQINVQTGYYQGSDFIDAEADGMGGAESAVADPNGMTDLWITGKLRVMRGERGHLALIGGVKLPTGEDDELLSNGEPLEPSSQPGTGSVDYLGGIAYSRYLTGRLTLDASGIYTLRTEHDDFQVGDRFDLGLALAWRLTESIQSFPNASVSAEVLGTWIGKDDDDGDTNENSGGTVVYFAPGFRERFSPALSLAVAPAFPIAQDPNGDQVDTDAKLAVSLDWSI